MIVNEGWRVGVWRTGAATALLLSVGFSDVAAAPLEPGALMNILEKPVEGPPKAPPAINLDGSQGGDKNGPVRDNGVKVRVDSFHITGATVFPQDRLLELLDSFKGRELTFAELNDAVQRLTGFYRDQGYFVATAYLPPQELTPNKEGAVVLHIAVVEGRLGAVHVNGTERFCEERAREFLAPLATEEVLLAKDVERRLLLLGDVPGVAVQSTMKPGKAPGTSDLDVVTTGQPLFSGSLDVSNYGSQYTGDYRGGLTLNVNNPLGIGDQITLRGITSEDKMWFGRVGYALPVNTMGTRVGGYYSEMNYDLNGNLSTIGGDGSSYGLFASHPFIRSRLYNLYGQLAWDRKLSNQEVGGILSTRERPDVYTASVSGDLRDGWGGGGMNTYELSLGHIVNNSLPVTSVGQGSNNKLNASMARLQSLFGPASLYVAGSGQYSGDNLISSEQFRLGGPSGVRAYPQGEGSGDSGFLLSADLRYDLPFGEALLGSTTQAVLFGDVGGVHLNTPVPGTETDRTLSGVGVGLNLFNTPHQFSIKWNLATQLGNEPVTSDSRQGGSRTWIQLVKWF